MARLEDAIADFEKVLHLDAQNKDAKAEISALKKELVDEDRRRKERRQPPLDLDTEARKKESKGGTPRGEEGGSSVEAARRFLEQVGMDGNAPTQKPNSKSATSDTVPPPRFPGETGGMLREVSTRKLERTEGSPATATGQTSSSVDTGSLQVVESSARSDDATDASNEATIASLNALSSLGTPKRSSASAAAAAATAPRPPMVNSVMKRRLNAYDFHRAWREVSAGSSQDILDFLSSLDLEALPQTLGSLLEPDLLVSLLAGLTSISTKQQDGSEVQHTNVVGTVMRVLPSCDRFETALMFLSPSEKDVASTILDSLRRNKYASIESIGRRWSF
ncbi:hypothetical protein FA10DRAFT_143885 [Acaromyces ingoldii]|uniref:RNA-polymerase II-associated protein 3-like C-terminal domain-containing protein n=1 Tax=Acaromyces ingoldii TaxID=215250 RepID=A0A316YJJ6_9BASI|nr:hypothetical protein FA10DRAFT_143885 [Acaromyces ingoldii]PWN89389.1 hypothetical protein FA10DRAFT_143885 [Acaromyces ingoldii]